MGHRTHFEIKIYMYTYIHAHMYMYIYVDQICVEVFEKTIRRTEIINHLFERELYGA